ncbi:aspartate/glutamate racemase family protein [Gemmatimonas groenlandica]|uniref:Uncharacterized protein n=1 Tax=Gemmatimonas groenlandica TaxID=2732249 RepID=A0A6M4IVY7_9BACT|nr:aspartate/glutamate racemase family protein [Gemmatimonas groenlandica]QJR37686.1 hypothetical protein HKW67_20260 [Gemmatimonas groenlandica]
MNDAIHVRGLTRIGILGTRTVMASRLYGRVSGAEVIPPAGAELDAVHDANVEMAASGFATDGQRAVFDGAVRGLLQEAHVEAILLGGTDLALVYREDTASFPLVNAAAVHVDAIVAATRFSALE